MNTIFVQKIRFWCRGLPAASPYVLALALFLLPHLRAVAAPLTYQYQERIFTIDPGKHPAWRKNIEHYAFGELEIALSAEEARDLPAGVERSGETVWDRRAIAETLEKEIGGALNHETGHVRIFRNDAHAIAFEGTGFPGRTLDTPLAAALTIKALAKDVRLIQLPVRETPPLVQVDDPELTGLGIREVVSVGESDFTGSPKNRKHNIGVGLRKFNGSLIPQGKEFSFGAVLGTVDASTGYLNELTIRGDRTKPEYGGGLCQVSTTAFRGVWQAGFPITERINHSFAVRYYSPEGTDATVYPPVKDMRFVNDSPGALLIQTLTEDDHAYFLYYGTRRQDRETELAGPFTWDIVPPPPDRTVFTTEIPPGETQILGKAVPGMKTMWYRIVRENGRERQEPFYSHYEARPYFEEIGVFPDDPRLMTEMIEDHNQNAGIAPTP